jgi:hypothetical protein
LFDERWLVRRRNPAIERPLVDPVNVPITGAEASAEIDWLLVMWAADPPEHRDAASKPVIDIVTTTADALLAGGSDAAHRPLRLGRFVGMLSAARSMSSRQRCWMAFAGRGGACPRSANVSVEAPLVAVRG